MPGLILEYEVTEENIEILRRGNIWWNDFSEINMCGSSTGSATYYDRYKSIISIVKDGKLLRNRRVPSREVQEELIITELNVEDKVGSIKTNLGDDLFIMLGKIPDKYVIRSSEPLSNILLIQQAGLDLYFLAGSIENMEDAEGFELIDDYTLSVDCQGFQQLVEDDRGLIKFGIIPVNSSVLSEITADSINSLKNSYQITTAEYWSVMDINEEIPEVGTKTTIRINFERGLENEDLFKNMFENILTLKSVKSVGTSFGTYYPDTTKMFNYAQNLERVDLREGNLIETIGSYMFTSSKSLSNIILPDSIKEISYRGISATKLETITIPDSVTLIGEDVFSNNEELKEIIFGKSVQTLGNFAVERCTNLNLIISKCSTAPTIGDHCFYKTSETGTLYYPKGSDYSTWLTALGSGWTGVEIDV